MKHTLALAAAALLTALPAASADTYSASAGMSYVVFQTRHFGVSTAHGRFNEFTATIEGDPADSSTLSVQIEVAADSVDTGIEKRDEHLRNPDFFNAKEFPTIAFQSTGIAPVEGEEDVFTLTGDLTLLGETREVTARLVYLGAGTGAKGQDIIGADATFTIKRTDFGMNYGAPDAIGDDVHLTVSLQADKQ